MQKQSNQEQSCRDVCVNIELSTRALNEIKELIEIWYSEGFLSALHNPSKATFDRKERYEGTLLFLMKSLEYRCALTAIVENWQHGQDSKDELIKLLTLADPTLNRN
ncbi:hypothetical protein [Vibrio agarivorans]|uniref:hypothetical protein n=1 Tax=Vibrio agarivorans TaxID=153622 RepID=UPI00222EACD7|nr:hypothetical protein [Vibrio agarivorans]MDN3659891.1 hypothetical protein [Vibrio agarivorans]